VFPAALAELGAGRLVIRPYRPQTNGKAERDALGAWLEHDNRNRPDTAIGNQPPIQALDDLSGNCS
jgi:transposase InsO family protein